MAENHMLKLTKYKLAFIRGNRMLWLRGKTLKSHSGSNPGSTTHHLPSAYLSLPSVKVRMVLIPIALVRILEK